ncbi:MAG: hypothetical protein ACREBU_01810 [Nitrososphaera sp.]
MNGLDNAAPEEFVDIEIPLAKKWHFSAIARFEGMEVNGKARIFAVPKEEEPRMYARRITTASFHYGKRHGRKFKIRTIEHNGKKAVAAWRVL